MPQRIKTILLFGGPGAGKGTQGKLLGAIPGFHHVSSGDIFRGLDPDSELGRLFREYSARGELVPDDATIRVWRENMRSRVERGVYTPSSQLLVLDGIPRNITQARLLKDHIDVLQVLHLVCPDKEEMITRLLKRAMKEGRADDAREDVIRRRWDVYASETQPMLDYYPRSVIREVNAVGSLDEVLRNILTHAGPLRDAHTRNPVA